LFLKEMWPQNTKCYGECDNEAAYFIAVFMYCKLG